MSSDRAYRTLENINQRGKTLKIMEECSVKFVIGINRSNSLGYPSVKDPPFKLKVCKTEISTKPLSTKLENILSWHLVVAC
jgi:hypothetical protein